MKLQQLTDRIQYPKRSKKKYKPVGDLASEPIEDQAKRYGEFFRNIPRTFGRSNMMAPVPMNTMESKVRILKHEGDEPD